jgi:tRNA G18 (ribose-2'-O)-methylase SpoU
MEVFLDSPQDFGNLCLLSRTLELLDVERCYVHDPHRLVRPRYGKSRTRQIKHISAGAFFRVAFQRVEHPEAFLSALPGRKVATVPDQHATALPYFAFRSDEVIVFGSEGRGIRPEVLALCDERVTIPQRGMTDSLNLAVSIGIVLFEFFRQAPTSYRRSPR